MTTSVSTRLVALMGGELARFEASWPFAQEAIFVPSGERLAALMAGLPRSLDELGAAWTPIRARAHCIPPGESADPTETLQSPEWISVLDRRERGATVQLSGCESAFPALAGFVADLKAELALGKETDSTASIFTARAGRGIARHRDSKDVWIIGLAGQKTVRTAPEASTGPDHRRSIDESPLPMPASSKAHTLARGDVLYIPRGCWHETRSEVDGTFSISIGLTRPWRAEVMAAELLELLSLDARWRLPIVNRNETIPKELIRELAGELGRRVWRCGGVQMPAVEVYARNPSAELSLVGGKLRVESCGELTNLTISSKLDLSAFVAFLESRETFTAKVMQEQFSNLDERACKVLLKLLFQGGLLRQVA